MRYLEYVKKIFVLAVAAISISIVSIRPSSAGDAQMEWYLYLISQYTYGILQFVQNPQNFAGLAVSWMQQDTGDTSITTKAQQSFATTGFNFVISKALQTALLPKITSDLLGRPPEDFAGKEPNILIDLPNVNDLIYASLAGVPPVANTPVDMYGYIKNSAGMSIYHPLPEKSWQGDDIAKDKYRAYYNTITSVQSFNAYVISQLAVDNLLKTGSAQEALVSEASSSSWIAQIATEELGRVIRQILLFTSQNYVLNTQIQQSMRQLVAEQAMTNTLLISLNQINEAQMVRRAKGLPQGE